MTSLSRLYYSILIKAALCNSLKCLYNFNNHLSLEMRSSTKLSPHYWLLSFINLHYNSIILCKMHCYSYRIYMKQNHCTFLHGPMIELVLSEEPKTHLWSWTWSISNFNPILKLNTIIQPLNPVLAQFSTQKCLVCSRRWSTTILFCLIS